MRMMKNNKNETIMVIGIDHGYGNMKTANRCFPSGVARYDKEPIFQNNLLVYNGMYYQIGEEHKEFCAEKTQDEDYYVLTLAAIAKQMKNLPDTTDKWKQLAKEQAASLELVTKERDELQVRNQKMNEFILEFQERTHKVKMEKQKLFFENHEMQDEIRKLNDEIHRLTIEMFETQKLNQLLQQSNDDLRNRNGLKSRREQEQFEEEIKDVRDQNCKLQIQVNKSSVEAVDEAQKKQKEAEKKVRIIEYQSNKEQEKVKKVMGKTDQEIKKLKNEVK